MYRENYSELYRLNEQIETMIFSLLEYTRTVKWMRLWSFCLQGKSGKRRFHEVAFSVGPPRMIIFQYIAALAIRQFVQEKGR
jgi:hypothetical protein